MNSINNRDVKSLHKYQLLSVIIAGLLIAILGYWSITYALREFRKPSGDKQTVVDIKTIDGRIYKYARINNKLPDQLIQLGEICSDADQRATLGIGLNTEVARNCVTNRIGQFKYRVISNYQYEICASFKSEAHELLTSDQSIKGSTAAFYNHPAGEMCETINEIALDPRNNASAATSK